MSKVIHIIIALTIICGTAKAQQNITLYNMKDVAQRNTLNPAFVSSQPVHWGLPLFSHLNFSYANSSFAYSDLFRRSADDSLMIDVDNVLSKMGDENLLSTQMNTGLLSLGINFLKCHYVSVSATEKITVDFSYPKNFMELLYRGNGAMLGEEIKSTIAFDAMHYREYRLSYAYTHQKKFTFGTAFKYLYGLENISIRNGNVSVYTDPNSYDITASTNVHVNTSGVVKNSFDEFSFGDYMFHKNNTGIAFDFGMLYNINEHFSVSASVIDVGSIRWNDDVVSYHTTTGDEEFVYQGININQYIGNDSLDIEDAFESFTDSLEESFGYREGNESYTTSLPAQVYAGTTYNLGKTTSASMVMGSRMVHRKMHPSFGVSISKKFGKMLSGYCSWSYSSSSFSNIGIGTAVNFTTGQFFIVSDNVPGIIFPQHAKNINLRTGINLTIGERKRKSN